jgi:tetratricopeptide (TPR) repeat protein
LAAREPAEAGAFARALRHLDRGRPHEALPEFDAALGEAAAGSERARIHNKRGVALIALGERDAALEAFCSAVECCEADAAAPLVSLGNLLLESGHPRDAIDYYRCALRLDEGYALAHANLAAALRSLGDRAGSVRALRAAARAEARRAPGRA